MINLFAIWGGNFSVYLKQVIKPDFGFVGEYHVLGAAFAFKGFDAAAFADGLLSVQIDDFGFTTAHGYQLQFIIK